jgi:hypothetical protein
MDQYMITTLQFLLASQNRTKHLKKSSVVSSSQPFLLSSTYSIVMYAYLVC